MEAAALHRPFPLPRSRRPLSAVSDERLAKEAMRGNQAAFEVIYDRYHRQLLAFCRHMLGSREDAEDALQQSFASAFRALPGNDRPAQLKAWLYTIARNHSLTILRARRERPSDEIEQVSFDGISEEVERRAELKHLLADVHDLPEKQRAALVLAEVSDLSHIQVSEVLDCEATQVKALVFQARTALLQSREARETPCAAIREEIANATGAVLRRGHLRRHVRSCEGCAEFEREVRALRAMLAVALPVIPSLGLKDAALAAMGIGGGGQPVPASPVEAAGSSRRSGRAARARSRPWPSRPAARSVVLRRPSRASSAPRPALSRRRRPRSRRLPRAGSIGSRRRRRRRAHRSLPRMQPAPSRRRGAPTRAPRTALRLSAGPTAANPPGAPT